MVIPETAHIALTWFRSKVIDAHVAAPAERPPSPFPHPDCAVRVNVVCGLAGVIHYRIPRITCRCQDEQHDARVRRRHTEPNARHSLPRSGEP